MSEGNKKRILLIDQQSYWREISTKALTERGFNVSTLDTYDYAPFWKGMEGDKPDLVVLGCARIRPQEEQVITNVLTDKRRLLVLCTSLSWRMMRHLFLQGVDDIVDKPYNPRQLVQIVSDAFENAPHNRRQGVERRGVS